MVHHTNLEYQTSNAAPNAATITAANPPTKPLTLPPAPAAAELCALVLLGRVVTVLVCPPLVITLVTRGAVLEFA